MLIITCTNKSKSAPQSKAAAVLSMHGGAPRACSSLRGDVHLQHVALMADSKQPTVRDQCTDALLSSRTACLWPPEDADASVTTPESQD